MQTLLSTRLLSVDAAKIHEVDTTNAQSLRSLWTVFSKCADYMEEGRRLENLSWRLWTRETFCVEPVASRNTPVLPRLRAESSDVPELSVSVDSAVSEADRLESHIGRPPTQDYKPVIVGEDSLLTLYRGKEKPITTVGLERMFQRIREQRILEPLSPLLTPVAPPAVDVTPVVDVTPRPSSSTPAPVPAAAPKPASTASYLALHHQHQSAESCSTTAPEGNDSDVVPAAGSDTSVSSSGVLPPKPALLKSPSIVRGFSPSHISSSYRSNPKLTPEASMMTKGMTHPKPSAARRKGGMFILGASSGDEESSFEDRMVAPAPGPGPQRSSLSEELSKSGGSSVPEPNRKMASFKEEVESRTIPHVESAHEDEDAIETDDEVSESAIDDEDDDSEWEDSVTGSVRSSVDEKDLFQRVDSRPNLVSRRSLLTMMIHQPAKGHSRSSPALHRSRVTSPNGPPDEVSADEDDENLTMRGPDVPRSKPITMKAIPQPASAHSPRTTRRNMLATELTESLRRHLLWERQQKSATANAASKRRHTAYDVANLQEYPGAGGAAKGQKPGVNITGPGAVAQTRDKEYSKNSSWNNYYDYGPWEYHAKGW